MGAHNPGHVLSSVSEAMDKFVDDYLRMNNKAACEYKASK